jgi:hypothetical protein
VYALGGDIPHGRPELVPHKNIMADVLNADDSDWDMEVDRVNERKQ